MPVRRAPKLIADADIPALIARDAEYVAADAAHVAALHPPAIYGFGQGISTENVFDFGSGFLDCRNGGGAFPPGMGHIQGFQARYFYTANKWGMQLVTQNNIDNECYFRTVSQDTWGPWRRIWNDGNFTPSNYLSQAQADSRYRQTAVALTDSDIPAAIARDSEYIAADAAHVAATDPHPIYLTQAEGDGRYRQTATALVDADIPAAIARDSETTAALNVHTAAVDPHPVYLTQAKGDVLYARQLNRMILTGNCPNGSNLTSSIPHGLVATRIKSFTSFALLYPGTISEMRIESGGAIAPWIGTTFFYSVDIGSSNINIRTSTNSSAVFGAQVTIVVDYQ